MSKRGRLDVEAEERYAEVQKGRENKADWTLKWREGMRKSKQNESGTLHLPHNTQ